MSEVLKKCVRLLWNCIDYSPRFSSVIFSYCHSSGSLGTKLLKTSASITLGYTLPRERNAMILKTIRSNEFFIFIAEAVMTGTHH